MRVKFPSSRANLRLSVSLFDAICAAVTPYLALVVRDAQVLYIGKPGQMALFQGICIAFSLFAFLIFRLHEGVTRYFSVADALQVLKAVLIAELSSATTLFLFTRLEGIPRSTLLVHALLLASGLIGARALARISGDELWRRRPQNPYTESIIMIGSTPLSLMYLKFLSAYGGHSRVIGFLDNRPRWLGRSIAGVPILGATQDLGRIIDEFSVHGIRTDRIIVGGDKDYFAPEEIQDINACCDERQIGLDFVSDLVGLNKPMSKPVASSAAEPSISKPGFLPSHYFAVKRITDFLAASALILMLVPVFVVVSCLVLIDVGPPILFWQQRMGQGGRSFLLQKFRTMKLPFDWRGNPVPEEQRHSWIGRMLRRTRLDELPQLLNVVVGDMSLIGPRPLLPQDQPPNPEIRLMVRPGISGWAQVTGGTLISPKEKDALDEWYIRNASFWLDVQIMLLTLRFALTGERREERAIAEALSLQRSLSEPRSSG